MNGRKNREIFKRVPKLKYKGKKIDQISSRLFKPKGSRVLPLEIRNASLALISKAKTLENLVLNRRDEI